MFSTAGYRKNLKGTLLPKVLRSNFIHCIAVRRSGVRPSAESENHENRCREIIHSSGAYLGGVTILLDRITRRERRGHVGADTRQHRLTTPSRAQRESERAQQKLGRKRRASLPRTTGQDDPSRRIEFHLRWIDIWNEEEERTRNVPKPPPGEPRISSYYNNREDIEYTENVVKPGKITHDRNISHYLL